MSPRELTTGTKTLKILVIKKIMPSVEKETSKTPSKTTTQLLMKMRKLLPITSLKESDMEDFLPKPLGSAVMNSQIMIRKQLQGKHSFLWGVIIL